MRRLRTDVPAELAAVIERMMAKSPDDRFATPAEVAAAMAPFAAGCDLARVSAEAAAAAKVAETLERAVAITDSDPHDVHGIPPLPLVEGRGEGGLAASPPRRRRWLALAAGGAAAAIFFGIVFLVSTGEGTVKLEFADAEAAQQCTVSVDGNEILIEKLGEPIKLRPGRHQLRIRHGDLEIETREFDVVWRGTQVLHVSMPVRPGEIAAAGRTETKQPDDSSRAQHLAETQTNTRTMATLRRRSPSSMKPSTGSGRTRGSGSFAPMAEIADGQLDAYRRHCAEMLRYFRQKEKTAHRACKDVCRGLHISARCGFRLVEPPLPWPSRAVKMCPEEAGYMVTRGAVLYRAGRWEEALGPLTEGHQLQCCRTTQCLFQA